MDEAFDEWLQSQEKFALAKVSTISMSKQAFKAGVEWQRQQQAIEEMEHLELIHKEDR